MHVSGASNGNFAPSHAGTGATGAQKSCAESGGNRVRDKAFPRQIALFNKFLENRL